MPEPFKTTSIVIGDTTNTISEHADGSMLFKDPYVEVKLKDLFGGTIILNPAIIVRVGISDWLFLAEEDLYTIILPHNYNLVGSQKASLAVDVMNINYEKIGIDTIISLENSVYLKITAPVDVYVTIKKL